MGGKNVLTRVVIIGVGLIGGSLGMAIKRLGLAAQVVGVGRNEANLRTALEVGAVDEITTDAASGVRDTDLVVVATPVSAVAPVVVEISPHLKPGTIVTDVASTKASIVGALEPLGREKGFFFVGGHPMTGSERSGVQSADPFLFENAYYILTRTAETDTGALDRMRDLTESIGARVVELSPEAHDFYIAAVSHLPHCIAATLVNTIGGMEDRDAVLPFAAGGFRDTTRVAAGDPAMWRDILLTNARGILQMLGLYKSALDELVRLIEAGDAPAVEEWLKQAQSLRQVIPAKSKGYLPELFEIVVTVPDKPGVIAQLAAILGDADINISDIEILRVREGEGGTIRLGFATGTDQDEALRLLRREGIESRKR
jgi:prephenate dehydrogenase